MKRSRAFILAEQLLTIMLQAGFILVLCGSFYQLTSFYANVNQVLTARNHAERVISFVDDKIRHAGLGLWDCKNSEGIKNSAEIRARLGNISQLATKNLGGRDYGYKLPVALMRSEEHAIKTVPEASDSQNEGDILSLLYAQKDSSSGESQELILFTKNEATINGEGTVELIDSDTASRFKHKEKSSNTTSNFELDEKKGNINNYAVAESVGVPLFLKSISGTTLTINTDVKTTIPAATELMYLKFMQMFVHDAGDGEGRQFAYIELDTSRYDGWSINHNQEKGILEIYMTLDKDNNTFTLYVLASGGEDQSVRNPRPESWPPEAHPTADEWANDNESNPYKDYKHHIVYVSRASWKLNNLEGFTW